MRNLKIQKFKNAYIYTIQKYVNILTTEYPLYVDCGFLCIYGKFYGAKIQKTYII